MKKIIFATGNSAKINQMNFVKEFIGSPLKIINGKEQYGDDSDYPETQETTEAIAKAGALLVAKKIGHAVIAEDTDLCVEAIDDFPGVRAGLFLKNFGRDGLLKIMKNQKNRRAVITSSCCYATPDGNYKNFTNKVHGVITATEAFGDYPDWVSPLHSPLFGGGYSAIFMPDGHNKTLAEISPEDALNIGYREKNFVDIIRYIENL